MRLQVPALRPRRAVAALAGPVTALALLVTPAAASAADSLWRLEQPAPPAGAPFKVALGAPGDLQFWSRSRGLLAVSGNAVIPRGLFSWNGSAWRQLAVVCGGSGDTTRIAWAGPAEFWVISAPSRPRIGDGIALCHFKDGQVVASYGTLPNAADPYQVMNAATCASASDCWFGGPSAADPTGGRSGAFRLHWDGQSLTTSYGPQGRGITDLAAFAGTIFESVLVGPAPEVRDVPQNREPESAPRLLHRLDGSVFAGDPFQPSEAPGGTELLGLDAREDRMWAVGGGAASGPDVPDGGVVDRPPLAATRGPGDAAVHEVPLIAPGGTFSPGDRFSDVAAVPGTSTAWVTVQPFADRKSVNAKARVALIDAATGQVTQQRLPLSGGGRGSAARIACPAANDCWLATYGGWLFHYSDGTPEPVEDDPAFGSLITFRPNEAAAQFVPDTPPVDDSLLLAPPPVEIQPAVVPPATKVKKVPAVIRDVRKPKLRGTTLVFRFRLTRRARVSIVARRRGQVVARTKLRLLPKGHATLKLKLNRRHWPTKLSFVVRIPGQTPGGGADTGDSVTT